jgi:pimeloyl-ACP methyl ester carboxylesterase
MAAFADDLAWLCSELGVIKPIVVGHSMGGNVALEFAARYPEIPKSIVLSMADLIQFRSLTPHLLTAQTLGSGHFSPLFVPDQINAMLSVFAEVYSDKAGPRYSTDLESYGRRYWIRDQFLRDGFASWQRHPTT